MTRVCDLVVLVLVWVGLGFASVAVAGEGDEGPAQEQADTPPGLDDGGEARTYTVSEKVCVPTDGRPHRIEFDRWEEPAEREFDRDYEETTIRKRRLHDLKVEIYLANHTGSKKSLRLVERVPVPEIEQVEVEIQQEETTAGYVKDDQGLLNWTLDLETGEEKRVELAFRVSMPHSVVWHG